MKQRKRSFKLWMRADMGGARVNLTYIREESPEI